MIRDMRVVNANYWDDSFVPKKPSVSLPKKENNAKAQDSAEIYAELMRRNPSFLEKMMMDFLHGHNIKYEFQKIFYIAGKNQYIQKYYIVDFYIPTKKLIIEVDGKFHKEQEKKDKQRTETIKQYYRKTKVYRFTYNDFKNPRKMAELLRKVK